MSHDHWHRGSGDVIVTWSHIEIGIGGEAPSVPMIVRHRSPESLALRA